MDIKIYGIIAAIIAIIGGGYLTNAYVLDPSSGTVKARALKYSAKCSNQCEEDFAGDWGGRYKCTLQCEASMCKKYRKKLKYCYELARWKAKVSCNDKCSKKYPILEHKEWTDKKHELADGLNKCNKTCKTTICEKDKNFPDCYRGEFMTPPTWEGTTEERKSYFGFFAQYIEDYKHIR